LRPVPGVLLAFALCAASPVHGQDPKVEMRVAGLRERFQELARKRAFGTVSEEQVEILRDAGRIKDLFADRFLADLARDPGLEAAHEEILKLLVAKESDAGFVKDLFLEHMAPNDPFRPIARKGLLARAVRTRDDSWLRALFGSRVVEDRFLALEGMGRIGLGATLHHAQQLLDDPSWQPAPGTTVTCGTIGRSLTTLEGADAARILLLLRHDPRFTAADAADVREATRLWKRKSLLAYIDVAVLAHPDLLVRLQNARFMGQARVEAARAPLLAIARDRSENQDVRAAAAEALGGLTLARADLARNLQSLLAEPNAAVQRAAVRGLGALRVRQAAEALADLMGGPLERDARAALAAATGQPPATDWRAWLASPDCPVPVGT
jgi:hypothetical protein